MLGSWQNRQVRQVGRARPDLAVSGAPGRKKTDLAKSTWRLGYIIYTLAGGQVARSPGRTIKWKNKKEDLARKNAFFKTFMHILCKLLYFREQETARSPGRQVNH